MKIKPLISVILPTYNRLIFLPEAVESILAQTLADFELIIINDGSTDDTESWVKQQKDERIRYISYPKNQGVSYARNKGLDAAKGKYIAFMDSDDISEKTRFEEQVAILEADDSIAVCGSDIRFFGLADSLFEYREHPLPFRVKALFQTPFHFPACMMSRSFLEKEKIRFRPEVRSADDYYFLMKTMAKGRGVVIPKALYKYRWHSASISLQYSQEQKDNEKAISQLAFEEILNLKLTDKQVNLFYRFYRNKAKKSEIEEIEELITLMKQSPNLSEEEKEKLVSFLVEKKCQLEQSENLVLTFLKKVKSIFSK